MNFVIAFDTNMLLDMSGDCMRYVEELAAPFPRFKLALDSRGLIKKEYEREYDKLLRAREGLLNDSILAQLLNIIDRDESHVVCLEARFPKREKRSLKHLSCRRQIELTLFSIAKHYPGSACVLLTESLHGRIPRGYPNNYPTIRSRYLKNNYRVQTSLDRIVHDSRCPTDYESLEKILGADRRKWDEHKRCEFKQMYSKNGGVQLGKEVCGMLNNDGGYIFIGITDPKREQKITGFDWAYKGGIRSSSEVRDAMENVISDCIHPIPAKKVELREVWIPKNMFDAHEMTKGVPAERLMVVAIYVSKGADDYCFYDRDNKRWLKYIRFNSSCKIERCPHQPGFHPRREN
ncbi:MAG: ATP-binding protein [Acidobacteria bacterium]|nr:ATP-binding protein [Acidobacteriota bacterium]